MNKLLHGDCYTLIQDIPDNSVDLVYVDIPYLYKNGGSGKSALDKRMLNKRISLSDIDSGIDYSILEEFIRVCKKPYIYIWCSKAQIYDIMNFFQPYKYVFELLVWCKTNPSPTTHGTFLPDIEYCLMFRDHGTTFNEKYSLQSKWYMSGLNVKDKQNYDHPTIKPLTLVQRHIELSTNEGDTVLDCFMGSGTTGVACVNLKRNFIGIELNDDYFKMAEHRIHAQETRNNSKLF